MVSQLCSPVCEYNIGTGQDRSLVGCKASLDCVVLIADQTRNLGTIYNYLSMH